MSPDRSPRLVARLRLLHHPFARGVRGDAAQVHPAGAVLDKYQDVKSFHQHGVCVQEVHRDDPGGRRAEELPLARARAARRRIDARSMQDLPHGGRRHGDAEFCQFAVDAAVSPERILLRQANDQAGYARDRRRAPRFAPVARVVPARGQFPVPGRERRWRDGEDVGPAPAGDEPVPGRRTTPGRPARTATGRPVGAALRSRARAPAQRPSPYPCGIAARPARVSGEPASRRS